MTDTKPVAWIHAVTNGEDEDYALSFAPDNFPLKGIAGFKSVDVQPLYTKAQLDAAVAQERAEVERLRAALRGLLDDTQHAEHPDCEDGPCPVREARAALEGKT